MKALGITARGGARLLHRVGVHFAVGAAARPRDRGERPPQLRSVLDAAGRYAGGYRDRVGADEAPRRHQDASAGRSGGRRRYRADAGGQRTDWSYYGAAHRYAVHRTAGEARDCAWRMDRLEADGNEARLRELAGAGDRCAFIRLIEIMVDGDRIEDLRVLARAGDGRAFSTLMEYLVATDNTEQLRAEIAEFAEARGWLAQLYLDRGEHEAGLAELAAMENEAGPESRPVLRARRIDALIGLGRSADVRAMAEAGDRTAIRRLRRIPP